MEGMQQALWYEISQIASDPARRIYAVMDGAQFDNLPERLASCGLAHRSLYRNLQDVEVIKAGPWLVDPYSEPDPLANVWGGMPFDGDIIPAAKANREGETSEAGPFSLESNNHHRVYRLANPVTQLEKVIQVVGKHHAAVFWAGGADLSEQVLWRHLRTINMISIPVSALPMEQKLKKEESHVTVTFRHADSNVMAQVLPCLDEQECRKLCGPAQSIFFNPDKEWGPEGLSHLNLDPSTTQPVKAGMLRLSDVSMGHITERRAMGVVNQLVTLLQSDGAKYGDNLRAIIEAAVLRARQYKLETYDDILLFAETEVKYGPEFEEKPEYEDALYYLKESSKTPTEKIYYASRSCTESAGEI
jgi:hypothetical protein